MRKRVHSRRTPRFAGPTPGVGALLFAVVATTVAAQDSFDEWLEEQNRQFAEFLSSEDAAFSEYLRSEWEAFEAFRAAETFYEEPKLEEPPIANDSFRSLLEEARRRKGDAPRRTAAEADPPPPPPPPNRPAEPRAAGGGGRPAPPSRNAPPPRTGRRVELEFHGAQFAFTVDGPVGELRLEEISPAGFAAYWAAAAASGLDEVAEQTAAVVARYNLNPFSHFLAVTRIAAALYPRDVDAAAATWYVMVHSGYALRVAYSDTRVALLVPSPNQLYGTSYLVMDGVQFYMLEADGRPTRGAGSWRSYRGDYPDATAHVDLAFPPETTLPQRTRSELLTFSYRGEDYELRIPINEHIVDLMRDYPFTDWWVHFSPTASTAARRELVSQLRRIVAGRSNAEAANLLIRFVQTAFPYQTDQDQFGVEKWQAPEEILFYRNSDCDDRSILYAYLLQEVMGWDDVAVLHYPGHLAVAVPQARLGIDGDAVIARGVRYIVTDPTYIGADIGNAMPQFRSVVPQVLLVSDFR